MKRWGGTLWKRVGNVRRKANDGERLLWDSAARGQYIKKDHGKLK